MPRFLRSRKAIGRPRRYRRIARKVKPVFETGKRGFFKWLKRDLPHVYAALKASPSGLGDGNIYTIRQDGIDRRTSYNYDTGDYQLNDAGVGAWWDGVIDILKVGVPVYEQREAMKQQLRIAREGLPIQQTPTTIYGAAPPTDMASTMMKMAVPIGLGVAALLVIPKLIKK